MAVGVYSWSVTAGSNGSASTAVNFAENQTPASLNNSARALMAEIAGWLDSIGGSATYGGSSSDYTITNPSVAAWSAYAAGMLIALKANHTNDDTAVNVAVDGLANVRVKTCDGGDPAIGDIVSGGIYLLAHDGTNFQILNTIGGGSFQPLDATLTAFAAATIAADKLVYGSGSDTFATTDFTSFARTLLDDTTAAAAATTLGLGTGDSPQFTAINLGHASDTTLTRSAAGVLAVEGVDQVSVSGTQTLTNKTLTSPTINGGTAYARVAASSETGGVTLTSASANKTIQATGDLTINDGVFSAGDIVLIYAGSSSRSLIQDTGMTLRLHGTATTGTRTLAAYGVAVVFFSSASDAVVCGDVT